MTNLSYQPPVSNLLTYREVETKPADWPNYVEELGLTADHIPELVTLVQDEQLWKFWDDDIDDADLPDLGPEVESPYSIIIHAWRALGQLRAEAAVPALIKLLLNLDMDWAWEELPQVFAMIGPAAIAPLEATLKQPADGDNDGPQFTLVSGLAQIGLEHSDSRDRVVAILTDALAQNPQTNRMLGGSLCSALIDLEAVEAAPVIEAAYAEDRISPRFSGTWATVQVELGLKKKEDFDPEDFEIPFDPDVDPAIESIKQYLEELERLQKPTAQDTGLPLDYSHWTDGFGAPTFDALAHSPQAAPDTSKPEGFGGGSTAKKKKKSKKKKKG
jgi:hypothetical protein